MIQQAQEMAATGTCSSAPFNQDNNDGDDDGFFRKNYKEIKNALEQMLQNKDYDSILRRISEIIATGEVVAANKKDVFIKYLNDGYKLITHFDIGKAAHTFNGNLGNEIKKLIPDLPKTIDHINLEIQSSSSKVWDLHLILDKVYDIIAGFIS